MIIDDLYIAIRDRLLDPARPDLGIATVDWNNGQAEQWEQPEGKMDPLKLPCVLVRFEPPQWNPRGRKHYEAEGIIYLDVVQRNLDEPFTSDRRAAKVQKRRDSYAIVQAIGKRLVGMRGVGYGTFGLIGMEQDHDYRKLRVDTIAFRSLLCTDMDPETWTTHSVPDLVINAYPGMPVPSNAIIVVNSDASYSSGPLPPGTFVLPDVTHTDSNNMPVKLPAMMPMVCTPTNSDPGTAVLMTEEGDALSSTPVPPGALVTIVSPSGSAALQNSIGIPQGAATPVPAGASVLLTAEDAAVLLVDEDDTPIGDLTPIPSGEQAILVAPSARVVNRESGWSWSQRLPPGSVFVLPRVVVMLRDGGTVEYDYKPAPSVTHTEAAVPADAVRVYSSSDTWTKPAGLREIIVVAVGAGGGGGSGRRGAAGQSRSGGGGGGGGAIVWRRIGANELPGTVAVTIGAGGLGGPSVTTANTNGSPGSIGGDSSFGDMAIAKGGGAGGGGSTGGDTGGINGGLAAACTPLRGPWALNGRQRTAAAAAGVDALDGGSACPSGGGGGSITNANVEGSGGGGGGVYDNGSLIAGPAGAAAGAPGANGRDNEARQLLLDTGLISVGIGTAGAGGGGAIAGLGHGGNGGQHGAGGGGGGASQGSADSGAGGKGGDGLVIILEKY